MRILLACVLAFVAAAADAAVRAPAPAAKWAPAIANVARWRFTSQGAEALPKASSAYYRALEFIDPASAQGRAVLTPLYRAIAALPAAEAAWLKDAMENAVTMGNVETARRQSAAEISRMTRMLDAARREASSEAFKKAKTRFDAAVERGSEPLDDKRALRARIREVNAAVSELLRWSLYGPEIDELGARASDKLDELQRAWVARWGDEALSLGGTAVLTPGAVFEGKSSSGGKLRVGLSKSVRAPRPAGGRADLLKALLAQGGLPAAVSEAGDAVLVEIPSSWGGANPYKEAYALLEKAQREGGHAWLADKRWTIGDAEGMIAYTTAVEGGRVVGSDRAIAELSRRSGAVKGYLEIPASSSPFGGYPAYELRRMTAEQAVRRLSGEDGFKWSARRGADGLFLVRAAPRAAR